MSGFDHFIKHDCSIRYYGRHVDDFILVHSDKAYLQSLIPRIIKELHDTLKLTLHPRKIYLQHYAKGVQFLGVMIKPGRIYIANRTKGNFYATIAKQINVVKDKKHDRAQQAAFLSNMNSYLGIMRHYKTHRLRKGMLFKHLSYRWWNSAYLSGGITKFVLKVKPVKRGAWPF